MIFRKGRIDLKGNLCVPEYRQPADKMVHYQSKTGSQAAR
jgi:hypothetical protein